MIQVVHCGHGGHIRANKRPTERVLTSQKSKTQLNLASGYYLLPLVVTMAIITNSTYVVLDTNPKDNLIHGCLFGSLPPLKSRMYSGRAAYALGDLSWVCQVKLI